MNDRAYEIARNCGYDKYYRALATMVYKFLDKKPGSWVSVIEELAEELHKPLINIFKRREVYARFKNSIWAVYLAKIVLLSSK